MTPETRTPSRRRERILIVDDHALMRRGLRQLIEQDETLGVCGEADSIESALDLLAQASPDLVIVDLTLVDGSGLDLVGRIHDRDPTIASLIWSMHDESLFAERGLRAGAMGYVSKTASADELVDAIHSVLSGRVAVSPAIAQRLLHGFARAQTSDPGGVVESLSNRELAVFELIGHGLTTREVAERFGLSVKTIDSHRENIKAKLGVGSEVELVRHAVLWVLEDG